MVDEGGIIIVAHTRYRAAPIVPAPVTSTAGAGDCHLAGLLTGLARGMPLAAAQRLGTLAAAMSVTSPHTIHKGINTETLEIFAAQHPVA